MNNHDDGTTPRHGMKPKTIRLHLRRKVDAWLNSIEDEDLRRRCKKEAIVTGGSIASMLLGEEVNDFDIYFRTKDTVKAVADYYTNQFLEKHGATVKVTVEETVDTHGEDRISIKIKSAGVASADEGDEEYQYFEQRPMDEAQDYLSDVFGNDFPEEDAKPVVEEASGEEPEYTAAFLSSNAISLRGKVQLILRFYGDPDKIHESYDFAHCMNYWESKGNKLTLRPEALEALLSRSLEYRGSRYPLCSIIRTRKFIARGWRINAGQYLKMAMQLNKLDLTKFETLEEQLTGVDVAYFSEVIEKLKQKDMESVDSAYLMELIDRMF